MVSSPFHWLDIAAGLWSLILEEFGKVVKTTIISEGEFIRALCYFEDTVEAMQALQMLNSQRMWGLNIHPYTQHIRALPCSYIIFYIF